MTAPPLVLASGSPRRTDLLDRLGLSHVVDPSSIDEEVMPGETPETHVERLAREKAAEVVSRHPASLVLAGDTVVVRDGEILGKPRDRGHAVGMLRSLSGRDHRVLTGLALAVPRDRGSEILGRVDEARVVFRAFGAAWARRYVETGEPMDKAGAYAIQGRGAALVTRVEGDYHTVVGLPVSGLLALLEEAGYHYAFGGSLKRGASPGRP